MKYILIIILFAGISFAQSAGNSGLSFLKIGAGSRNLSMGDNGTVLAEDASAVFYNPANLAFTSSDEVMLMHNQWIQDVSAEVIAARLSFFGLPVGIGINSTGVTGIEIRTRPGEKEGTFNAHYFMASLSTGYKISEDIAAGATVKYLYEGLYTDQSNGYAADFGFTWKNFYLPGLGIAAAVKNLGGMDTLRNDVSKLPSELRIGASYGCYKITDDIDCSAGVEFQKYFAASDYHINLGIEARYDKMFSLRAGYMSMYESKSFTTGIGIHYSLADVDYSFVPFSYDLGNAHMVTVRVLF